MTICEHAPAQWAVPTHPQCHDHDHDGKYAHVHLTVLLHPDILNGAFHWYSELPRNGTNW